MTAVWMRATNELRTRWRPWLSIALMAGISAAAVMTAAVGARRSETAVDRFLDYNKATNADVETDPSFFHAIAELPEVDTAAAVAFMLMGRTDADAIGDRFNASALALIDPTLTGGPGVLVAGRMMDLDDPTEAIVNETALRSGAVKIGGTVPLQGFTFDQLDRVMTGSTEEPHGPSATVTVVGAFRFTTDLSTTHPPAGVLYTGTNVLVLTPALYARVAEDTAHFAGLGVRLKRGPADLPSFTAGVDRITHGEGIVHSDSDDLQYAKEAKRGTDTEALALWLFGGFAAAAALMIVGQSISRQILLGAEDQATLRALGMTRIQTMEVALVPVAVAALTASAIGVATAILLSPLVPIGLAGQAEVDRGFHLDLTVILLGSAACIVALIGRAAPSAWRAAARAGAAPNRHPSRTAGRFARAGLPASSVAGVQMALDPGYGRNAVPVRTAVAGSVVAVAVLITALGFGSSLARLASSPYEQGWRWDITVGNPHSEDVSATAIPLLRNNPDVAGISALMREGISLDGRYEVDALGLETVLGDVTPPVLDGRAPRAPDEIALGTKALRALGKRIGDTVEVASAAHPDAIRLSIVGRTLITPIIVNGQITLGDGALLPLETLRSVAPPEAEEEGAVNVFLVRFAKDADRDAALASLRRDFPGTVLTPYPPAEIETLRRIQAVPFALAVLLGVLAAATIAHALVTTVRRRRRDLAILKTLGFVRRQVSATVAWQASTVAAVAAAIGLVAGAAGGRWLWTVFAGRLGVQPRPVIPLAILILVIPATLALANVIAALPARVAAATRPAAILRTE